MHPAGIEPALKASEASVLSIRLRVHKKITYSVYYKFQYITNLLHHSDYNITINPYCLVLFFVNI